MNTNRVITFQFLLRDEPGALSALLNAFTQQNANLMTVNSIAPTNGCGVVTIAAETSQLMMTMDEMLQILQQIPGVIKAEVLAAG